MFSTINLSKLIILFKPSIILKNHYAKPSIVAMGAKKKKVGGKLGPMVEKKVLPVETDVSKLVNYVCGSNLLKEGGNDIKLGVDSDYPDWLWGIHIGKPIPLEELDPETKQYWRRLRNLGLRRNNKLAKVRRF